MGLVDDALQLRGRGLQNILRYLAGQRALSLACHAKGLIDECRVALKRVTEALPEDHRSQKLLGRLSAEGGDLNAARLAFRTALEFVPDDVECRIELEMLEHSGGSTFDGTAALPVDNEEILEDLEIIEDEEPDTGLYRREPETAAVAPLEPHHDPLSTATLAELYVTQGFIHKALDIYRSIQTENPGNSLVRARIAALELQDLVAAAAPEGTADFSAEEFDEDESEWGTVPAFEVRSALHEEILSAATGDSGVAELPVPEAAPWAALTESDRAVIPSHGSADNALFALDGWLENIRRIKSCR